MSRFSLSRPMLRLALPLALVAASMGAAQAEAPIPERRVILQADIDLPGGDLNPVFEVTQQACVALCLADDNCNALTYNVRSRACFPKGQAQTAEPFAGAMSGQVLATDPSVIAEAERRIGAANWLRPEDVKAARDQAQELSSLYPGDGMDVSSLRESVSASAGMLTERVRWQGAVTSITDSAADWNFLSSIMLDIATSQSDDRSALQSALAAATNAWLRSGSNGVEELTRWAQISEKLDRGSDGLKALHFADQNGGSGDGLLAEMLPAFEERYGFRVTDNQLDSNSIDPRACVSFSDDLAEGVDFRPFVALPDPAMAVEADGSQLCVTGLTRGTTLKLTMRSGLPSANGEVLGRSVDVSMYVRDRAPTARFGGRAYVVPAGSDQGLTMYSVNAASVDLTLYRMSDRNLVRALRDEIFASPLDDWSAENFTTYMGEQVWTGVADVAPAAGGGTHPVNSEVATRLDLNKAAGQLTPGIYALTAQVQGASTDYSPPATQWFMISDLGLASWSGSDGLTVSVRGLSDAAAKAGIDVTLVSRGNAVLATAKTDDQGVARFDAGMTRGTGAAEPALITAATRNGDELTDLSFLSLIDPEFDLSDRGVEGNPSAPPVDVFVATDRGAYRAGETAYATIMTRDDRGRAIEGLPLTAVVMRPDGAEHARVMPAAVGAGGYTLSVPIPDTAPRGLWRVDFEVEKDKTLASAKLLVEDFRPERIAFDLDLPAEPQAPTAPIEASIDARWLFGAPAANLPVEGELRLTPSRSIPGWDRYVFGRADVERSPEVVSMPAGTTDDQGHFAATMELPETLALTDVPVEAQLTLTVREGAGRPVERRDQQLVLPGRGALGIRPEFEDETVAQGTEAQFSVVALGSDLAPQSGQVEWVLNRVDTEYQWYSLDGSWNWEPITRRAREANGTVDLTDGPATVAAMVDWGEYELVVTAANGLQASTRFYAGWGAATTGTDTPDKLAVTLDKPNYRIGDTAEVTIDAVADGVAVVSVLSNRVIALQNAPIKAGRNTISLPVTEDWGANAYVAVSAIRPVGAGTEELSTRAPIRAMGIANAAIDPGDRALQATLTAPAEADPRGDAQVTLAVAGASDRTVYATVWAVDQGILNLTGYEPPSASDHYLGQRRLGVGMRDLYGRLIMPGGAADGAIRAGGDAASMESRAAPPTEKLMTWFSGPVTLGPDGTASVSIPLPDFNGEVRVMALVWDDRGVGQTDTTMLVRDPVVMTATVPAFLSPGDKAEAQLALTHVTGPAGEVALSVENLATPESEVAGEMATTEQGAMEPPVTVQIAAGGLPPTVTLAEKQEVTVPLSLTAPEMEGFAKLRVSAKLPDGRTVTKDLSIPVQRSDAAVNRRMRITLAPGASQTVDLSELGAFHPGTGRVTMTSGALARLDVPGAIARLVTYPYGCTEQLSSGALPQLYVKGLMPEGIPLPPSVEPKSVDNAIEQILTRQASDGNFGLWRPDTDDRWLTAYVADFLGRARSQGHAVPDEAFKAALRAMQNGLNSAPDPQHADASDNAATAYAAYVLAREGQAIISDLRYYVDTGGDNFRSPMAAAQLGAALASYGDQPRADLMFRRAQEMATNGIEPDGLFRSDYGTVMRDRAGVLALAAEAGTQVVDRDQLARSIAAQIDDREARGGGLSTQEAGWVVLAAQSLSSGAGAGSGITLRGAALTSPVQDIGDAGAVPPVELSNTSAQPVDITIGATAVPVEPQPAGGTAFDITRMYYTSEGQQADPVNVPLGTRLVVVLDVKPLQDADGRLIIADPLPAGFEIDNPNLLSQGDVDGLDWLGDTAETEMSEFRQDRFAAAVNAYGTDSFRLAYRVRAVTAGTFHHPAATVEDMYRAERRGWTDSGTAAITR